MSIPPIRVVIVHSHAIFRRSLKHLLVIADSISVIAETQQYENAFDLITKVQPDVVLLDMQISAGNAIDFIRRLRTCGSTTGILILVAVENAVLIRSALDAGANSYVLKSAKPDEIAESIRDVYEASQIPIQLPRLQEYTQSSEQAQKPISI